MSISKEICFRWQILLASLLTVVCVFLSGCGEKKGDGK
jgi:predicted small secreted protein